MRGWQFVLVPGHGEGRQVPLSDTGSRAYASFDGPKFDQEADFYNRDDSYWLYTLR